MQDVLFSQFNHVFERNLNLISANCWVFEKTCHDMQVLDETRNIKICFDEGKFDFWCVCLLFENVSAGRYDCDAPCDSWLFERFRFVCDTLGYDSCKLANQLRDIFEMHLVNTDCVSLSILQKCREYSRQYPDIVDDMYVCFVIFYYFLIAEDHKAMRDVGSCITILAVHDVLQFPDLSIDKICHDLRGMKADRIKHKCHDIGIFHNSSPKLKEKKVIWNW